MKIIALEEHYGLPVIYEAAHKANDGVALVYDVLKKSGKFKDTKTGFPAGIYDLGEGRIAAMDDGEFVPGNEVPHCRFFSGGLSGRGLGVDQSCPAFELM